MARIYENHIRALEIDAYARLMRNYRATASHVNALADAMRGDRDLPMADTT